MKENCRRGSVTENGGMTWNNLAPEIRTRDITSEHYGRLLKAFLFV